jgi:hypothetical protein
MAMKGGECPPTFCDASPFERWRYFEPVSTVRTPEPGIAGDAK